MYNFSGMRYLRVLKIHGRIQKKGGGGPGHIPPEKNTKIGFPSNIDPDPLKSQNYQAIIQCVAIIGTPAKRHFNGVSLAGR